MNSAHATHDPQAPGLASWYTPGRSDGFGDRLSMFDNTDAISLELLRFRHDIAATPGFEGALRDRVDQLTGFRHRSFPVIRTVVHLDDEDLTLVSAHLPGQRLSELPTGKLQKGLHPAVVTWIVRELTPALAALQSVAPGVAHGALTADRIILASDGRLCIVEHALGSAIQRLNATPAVFWRQFGLLAPVDDRGLARLDQRTDMVQLATIALSLLLARPVTLDDFERRLPAMLDEFIALADVSPSVFAAPLRAWLERALQLAPRSYRSADEALEGLEELPASTGPAAALGNATFTFPGVRTEPGTDDDDTRLTSVGRLETQTPLRMPPARDVQSETRLTTVPPQQAMDEPGGRPGSGRRWKRAYAVWIATALGAIAVVQGLIITTLGTQPAVVTIAPPAAPAQQLARAATPAAADTAAAEADHQATSPGSTKADDTANAIAQAAARQRSGGLRFSSPIELNVFDGDRVLGSTADGPIVAVAGTHQLEFVNAALGYRMRQTVTIQAGIITPLTLPTPTGRINVNAQPWAQVLIDDNPVGETPLANVSVPLGPHEITFRHPQLGERRETVTVRADTIARVSTSFR